MTTKLFQRHFQNHFTFQLHMANLHNNVNSDCAICGEAFSNKHLLQVTNCYICNLSVIHKYWTLNIFQEHLKSVHSDEVALFQCMECDHKEDTLLAARKHYR